MTHCTGTLADRCLERYIQGTLPENEAQRFEEHFFDCPSCLAQVEALQTVTLKLGSQPRKALKRPIPWPARAGALTAIAAMLLLGFFGFKALRGPAVPTVATSPSTPPPTTGRPSPTAAPTIASSAVSRLADVTLPAFQMPHLRGQSGDPHFVAGMKAYTAQECANAVRTLSQVPAQDEDSLAAQFYMGACQMHLGDQGAASRTWEHVAAAGDSPQQEAALYYLAQVSLQRNDATKARHYLSRTISLHGDFERRARSELTQVR